MSSPKMQEMELIVAIEPSTCDCLLPAEIVNGNLEGQNIASITETKLTVIVEMHHEESNFKNAMLWVQGFIELEVFFVASFEFSSDVSISREKTFNSFAASMEFMLRIEELFSERDNTASMHEIRVADHVCFPNIMIRKSRKPLMKIRRLGVRKLQRNPKIRLEFLKVVWPRV